MLSAQYQQCPTVCEMFSLIRAAHFWKSRQTIQSFDETQCESITILLQIYNVHPIMNTGAIKLNFTHIKQSHSINKSPSFNLQSTSSTHDQDLPLPPYLTTSHLTMDLRFQSYSFSSKSRSLQNCLSLSVLSHPPSSYFLLKSNLTISNFHQTPKGYTSIYHTFLTFPIVQSNSLSCNLTYPILQLPILCCILHLFIQFSPSFKLPLTSLSTTPNHIPPLTTSPRPPDCTTSHINPQLKSSDLTHLLTNSF